jgi:hypothetical protein
MKSSLNAIPGTLTLRHGRRTEMSTITMTADIADPPSVAVEWERIVTVHGTIAMVDPLEIAIVTEDITDGPIQRRDTMTMDAVPAAGIVVVEEEGGTITLVPFPICGSVHDANSRILRPELSVESVVCLDRTDTLHRIPPFPATPRRTVIAVGPIRTVRCPLEMTVMFRRKHPLDHHIGPLHRIQARIRMSTQREATNLNLHRHPVHFQMKSIVI